MAGSRVTGSRLGALTDTVISSRSLPSERPRDWELAWAYTLAWA